MKSLPPAGGPNPAAARTLPNLEPAGADVQAVHYPCAVCGTPMVFHEDDGELGCDMSWCAANGMTIALWRAEQRRANAAGEPDATPAGLPRPRDAGRPIPWITPVAAGRTWFRLVHGERLIACQTRWLCQLCGQPLDPHAWVITFDRGRVLSSSAMHHSCARLAAACCPHLAASTRCHPVQVTRDMIDADGVPLPAAPTPPEGGQTWWLRHDHHRLAAAV